MVEKMRMRTVPCEPSQMVLASEWSAPANEIVAQMEMDNNRNSRFMANPGRRVVEKLR